MVEQYQIVSDLYIDQIQKLLSVLERIVRSRKLTADSARLLTVVTLFQIDSRVEVLVEEFISAGKNRRK